MKIFNTLTRQKEEFAPLEPMKVKMYSCGPTVYNFLHIGNARPLVVFDTVCRYFEYLGYEVNHVQNFTDVDDKIIKKANDEGVDSSVISERFINEALTDEAGLNIKEPTSRPKVTTEMPNIIKLIEELVEKGSAYEKNGTVYFNTATFENYGGLSKKNLEDLESGSRVGVDKEKTNVSDFVLWKPAKENEPKWESPWGAGRPGWHIECSAMIREHLGDSIDIHTGGEDLVFPHHENEIAQSEAATGKPLAKYWLHNGFLNVDNKKMSKSAGNFFTLRDITQKFSYDVVRFFIISAHYRMPINFSDTLLQASENGLNRLKNACVKIKFSADTSAISSMSDEESILLKQSEQFKSDFEASMNDDFNTADAVTALFEFATFANINITEKTSKPFAEVLLANYLLLSDILGLKILTEKSDVNTEFIENRIKERAVAKKNKDFNAADAIRAELLEMGVVLEDTAAGVRWSHK